MANNFFIAGTDTGVGKTLVTTALLRKVASMGLSGYGLKPIAAGCELKEGQLYNDDALAIQAESTVTLPYAQVNPVPLKAPIAPHIAAAQEGKRLQLERIEGYVRGSLMLKADWRFVEGAGGWCVPLAPGAFLSDLPKRLQLPVILVVGLRLGCLNHALLTAKVIHAEGLTLAGWVVNSIDPNMQAMDDNINTLQFLLQAPLLGVIPWLQTPSSAGAAEYLQLPSDTSESD